MKSKTLIQQTLGLMLGLGLAGAAAAQDASALGTTLTPVGAEKAANADGTIPAWDGGLTTVPAGFTPGGMYPDPYSADKPLFTITAANHAQYKDKLSAGQIAMFEKYPTYQLPVYPTRRSAAYPQAWYDETKLNPGKAQLAAGDNGIVGTNGGVAFPIPTNGSQVIWNAVSRYRGEIYGTNWAQAAVTANGSYTPVRFEYEIASEYGALARPASERADNMLLYFLQKITSPARLSGFVLLVHETVDQAREPRKAWTYNPGQRRVRLAPNVAYDGPGTAADGLRTSDDFGMFAGATDRYDWNLVGKREIYIPYNSYKISGNEVKMDDYLKVNHPNQEFSRYELHRVWVVDATLKAGKSHLYSRRTFYFDEDTWQPMLVDKYDGRGQLYRVGEMSMVQAYDLKVPYQTIELHIDLQSGRYLAMSLRNDEDKFLFAVNRKGTDFTPQSLRDIGFR